MLVLIAYEESQAVCKAFRLAGHEAYSCDLQDCSGGYPEWHLKGSIWDYIDGTKLAITGYKQWDLLIGHPPCTYLSNVGNDHFNTSRHKDAYLRWFERYAASEFFVKMLLSPIKRICLENPVGWINGIYQPTQIIEPYFFGNPDKKRTCLWLKNLPKLIHVKETDMFNTSTHVEAKPIYQFKREDGSIRNVYFTDAIAGNGSISGQKLRSKTFQGIADAMASQWGNL